MPGLISFFCACPLEHRRVNSCACQTLATRWWWACTALSAAVAQLPPNCTSALHVGASGTSWDEWSPAEEGHVLRVELHVPQAPVLGQGIGSAHLIPGGAFWGPAGREVRHGEVALVVDALL